MADTLETKDFDHVRAAFQEQGTRFDVIFDALKALDHGIKSKDGHYIQESLERIDNAAKMLRADCVVWAKRHKVHGVQ